MQEAKVIDLNLWRGDMAAWEDRIWMPWLGPKPIPSPKIWHIVGSDGVSAACGRIGLLRLEESVPATAEIIGKRCQKSGCRQRWAKYK